MCGIAGIYNVQSGKPADSSVIEQMIASLGHRGPDETGFHAEGEIGLGQCRLSIIDLSGGRQPIYNEDKSICVVFNGEIFNYIELRDALQKKGHRFYTHTDTEVLVHLYEEYGKEFLAYCIGQFGIALFDRKNSELIIARDRVGIRPLFYTVLPDGGFVFGSEMKAIFCHPEISAEIDPEGINQIFTLWVNIPPRTVFKSISELAPGHFMSVSPKGISTHQYWKYSFPEEGSYEDRPLSYYVNGLKEVLYDAVTVRLRADVPVAAYLSGGIDSSIISTLVKRNHNNDLITFSVAFADRSFDERPYQQEMADYLKTDHHITEANYDNIGAAFPDVVKYSEKPMIRTAPAPLFILSRLVRENNIKVVLTGEGADEIFGGYNIFKEDKVRRFWAKNPDSKMRPRLLLQLYPYIARDARANRFWQQFFKKGLTDTDNKYYSHLIRWNNTSQIKRFFSGDYRRHFSEERIMADLDAYVDPDIRRWHPLCRAQYLEAALFMSGYLLSTQGDRMMMGNSIEGRFPFLDHRVIEFAAAVPPKYKINVLNEKFLLKKAYGDILPEKIVNRAKQPYRAPISQCFINRKNQGAEMLRGDIIKKYGYFDLPGVEKLVAKCGADGGNTGERDDMALVGIVSLMLLHHQYIDKNQSQIK